MIGQGCPSEITVPGPRRTTTDNRRWATACAGAGVLFIFWASLASGIVRQESVPNRIGLRIVWGGATAKAWNGTITLSEGRFDNLVPLGLGEDDNVAISLSDSMLRVRQLAPTTFNGCDVRVNARLDAVLTLEMTSDDNPPTQWRHQGKVRELIDGLPTFELNGLDQRLAIQRIPGDQIQLEFEQDRLVFQTDEETQVRVLPTVTGFSPSTEGKLRVALIEESSGTRTAAAEISIKADDRGEFPSLEPIVLRIPEKEGVYDWEFTLIENQKRGPFTAERTVRTRRVQWVALSEEPPSVESGPEWQEAFAIDPARPDHWTMRRQINQLKLPTRYPPLAGNGVGVEPIGKQSMVRLDPKGWQAIPIPIDQPNIPHVIELEFVSSRPCSLGLSLLEPSPLGLIPNLGVDSGISIPSSTVQQTGDTEPTISKHRVTFWPKSKLPYLILANHDDRRPAVYGRIRLLNGPSRLSELPNAGLSREGRSGRQRMLLLERPTIVQVMNAPQAFDADNRQLFDDWKTLYTASDRLIQYLKANGYSGLVMAVAADGSAIYPSRLIQPTPRWDSGVYASTGQDPMRKDALDLLFRMFDRAGLTLIPVVELSNRIPGLEAQRIDGGPAPFDLFDMNGQAWSRAAGLTRRPPYNPLDASVQEEFLRLVDEICTRYARYRSFAGLGLAVNEQTANCFPDETWGWDSASVQQFLDEAKISRATFSNASSGDSLQRLLADHRGQWNAWRADRLAALYDRMQARVVANAPSGQLYLIPTDSSQDPTSVHSIAESVDGPPSSERLANMGIDTAALCRAGAVQLLDSVTVGQGESSAGLRPGDDPTVEEGRSSGMGVIFEHPSSWAHFEQWEKQNPLGTNGPIFRIQQLTPADLWNRRRYAAAIARADCTVFVDGGSTIPFGQEEASAHWAEALAAIPAVPFETVIPKGNHRTDSLVVRNYHDGAQSYFYVVNDSPWPVDAVIELEGSNLASLRSLTSRPLAANVIDNRGQLIAAVPAFEIIAAAVEGRADVLDFHAQLPIQSGLQMQREIQDLKRKLGQVDSGVFAGLLENPSFEDLSGDGRLVGWQTGPNHPRIGLDAINPYDGSTALSMHHEESAPWIRSNVFSGPQTGRMAVSIWMRSIPNERLPSVRVSLRSMDDESGATHIADLVRQDESGSPDAWQQYAAQFIDLPIDSRPWQLQFELAEPGDVWLDRVEIHDRWLERNDIQSLKQLLNLASYKLQEQGDSVGCLRILESYWPRLVADQLAVGADPRAESARAPNSQNPTDHR